jgi:hypothetical protein
VHGTEPSGSEMANQLSEYQNLKQHTLTSAKRMKFVLRAVRPVRLFYKGNSVQRLNAQWRTEGGLGCSTTLPPEIPKALQNRAKLNPFVKTVKNC